MDTIYMGTILDLSFTKKVLILQNIYLSFKPIRIVHQTKKQSSII